MSNNLNIAFLFSTLSIATIAQGAEIEIHPSIAVSEEYTDNVFETNSKRTSDFITRALPGLTAKYSAPALNADVSYVFDYRHYARNSIGDDTTHTLSAQGKLTAIEDVLFLDVSNQYQRVSLDATRDVTSESLFVNQSDRNVITASPYLILHPTARITAKPGYRFVDTRYFNSAAIDKTDHVAYLDLAYELYNRFNLTANYTFTRELADIGDFSQHQALAGFRYEYADKSFAFAQTGNTWTSYDSGQRLSSVAWNAGLLHVFDPVTCTLTTGVRYNEDPLRNSMKESYVNGTIEKRFNRGLLSFSPMYSEFVQTQTDTRQTNKYGATARGQYDLSADLSGRLSVTAEKYEHSQFGSYTRRIQVDSGLGYLLAKQLTATLSCIYVSYYTPGNVADSWYDSRHVNRAMIEIKKTF